MVRIRRVEVRRKALVGVRFPFRRFLTVAEIGHQELDKMPPAETVRFIKTTGINRSELFFARSTDTELFRFN